MLYTRQKGEHSAYGYQLYTKHDVPAGRRNMIAIVLKGVWEWMRLPI